MDGSCELPFGFDCLFLPGDLNGREGGVLNQAEISAGQGVRFASS
jgi:hypothetical protein